jgi:hypothetical protein
MFTYWYFIVETKNCALSKLQKLIIKVKKHNFGLQFGTQVWLIGFKKLTETQI